MVDRGAGMVMILLMVSRGWLFLLVFYWKSSWQHHLKVRYHR